MKKFILFISIFMFSFNVFATSGSIKQSSVIECDGILYGSHSDHWHIVKKENDKYVIKDSQELEMPSCYKTLKNESEIVSLNKCVDGDTAKFLMKDGTVKTARFLAIDTPESVHPTKKVEEYGKEASEYTCNLLQNANTIKVEYDKASEKTDKYGRILVWVYADDKMVQESLLENGLAKVAYLYANYEYTEKLQNIEKVAQNKKIGIWSSSDEIDISSTVESEKEDTDTFFDKILSLLKENITNLFNKLFELIKNSI